MYYSQKLSGANPETIVIIGRIKQKAKVKIFFLGKLSKCTKGLQIVISF